MCLQQLAQNVIQKKLTVTVLETFYKGQLVHDFVDMKLAGDRE